jgi:hypothetical protein
VAIAFFPFLIFLIFLLLSFIVILSPASCGGTRRRKPSGSARRRLFFPWLCERCLCELLPVRRRRRFARVLQHSASVRDLRCLVVCAGQPTRLPRPRRHHVVEDFGIWVWLSSGRLAQRRPGFRLFRDFFCVHASSQTLVLLFKALQLGGLDAAWGS